MFAVSIRFEDHSKVKNQHAKRWAAAFLLFTFDLLDRPFL
jgi:hypothetical protein